MPTTISQHNGQHGYCVAYLFGGLRTADDSVLPGVPTRWEGWHLFLGQQLEYMQTRYSTWTLASARQGLVGREGDDVHWHRRSVKHLAPTAPPWCAQLTSKQSPPSKYWCTTVDSLPDLPPLLLFVGSTLRPRSCARRDVSVVIPSTCPIFACSPSLAAFART